VAIRLREQDTGASVFQVTEDSFTKSNIYCEYAYCSADSRWLVYVRQNPDKAPNSTEYVVCELGTWEERMAGAGIGGPAITMSGAFYFLREADDRTLEVMKLDFEAATCEAIQAFNKHMRPRSLGTVTPDRRYYAYGVPVDDKYKEFGVRLVDLKTGECDIIDTDPYILNPHPQFEPSEGRIIMIQHNRGGEVGEDGKLIRLVGDQGATIYLFDLEKRERIQPQVGKPYTTPITGHQSWVADTKEIVLSVRATDDYAPEKGNLLGVTADGPPRVVGNGFRYAHVGTSRCGRLWCCDDGPSGDVLIGSIKAGPDGQVGRKAVVCHSESSFGRDQNTHPHAYITPDLKWVIFNSDRSGIPQVHAAQVPEGMVDQVLEG